MSKHYLLTTKDDTVTSHRRESIPAARDRLQGYQPHPKKVCGPSQRCSDIQTCNGWL